jgi:DNA-binding winged helix-turn-helix (wHTH) protein
VTVRILADAEPYSAYADEASPLAGAAPGSESRDPYGSLVILNGPAGLDEALPDCIVLPVQDFLVLGQGPILVGGCLYIAFGPVSLMEPAFALGCADYIREPWSLAELRARVLRFRDYRIRIGQASLELRGEYLVGARASVRLNETERALFRIFVVNSPHPVPQEAALALLSPARSMAAHSLSRHTSALRRKLNSIEPGLGNRIRTIRGFGYRLDGAHCG